MKLTPAILAKAEIHFNATSGRWHVIYGASWVEVLYKADTERECRAWLARKREEAELK